MAWSIDPPHAGFAALTDADIKAEMRALKRAAFDPYDTTDARFTYFAYFHELTARWVRDHAPHLLRKPGRDANLP